MTQDTPGYFTDAIPMARAETGASGHAHADRAEQGRQRDQPILAGVDA